MEQHNDEEQQKIREENEIKKIKLALEHGAKFSEPSDSGLSPEMESQWLDYIAQFEEGYDGANHVPIYEFIGSPEYTPADEIPGADIKAEVDRLMDLLAANNIITGTECDLDERDFYRFLTEEVFRAKIGNFRIEGMFSHYHYEDFHPNNTYDIERHCRDFIEAFLKNGNLPDPTYIHLASDIETSEGLVDAALAVEKIEIFRQLFRSFELQHCDLVAVDLGDDASVATFDLSYTGVSEGNDHIEFKGRSTFTFVPEYGYMWIRHIDMPGLKL